MTIKSIPLEVTGDRTIHCDGCENTIRRALGQLPGVRRVEPSQKTQKIVITLDIDLTPIQEVQEKLDWMGWGTQKIEEKAGV